jgi:hypothetical protein
LLALQVVEITLPFRIGHAFIATLCVLRQLIIVLTALAIRHRSISALFVPVQMSEFEIDRRVRARGARVSWVQATAALVAMRTGVTGPIRRFQPSAVIPPVPLLCRPIIPTGLILKTLGVARIDDGVEAANDVANALGGTGLHREYTHQSDHGRGVKQPRVD